MHTRVPIRVLAGPVLAALLLAGCGLPVGVGGLTPARPAVTPTVAPTVTPTAHLTARPATPTATARPDGLTPTDAAALASLQKVDDYPLYTMHTGGAAARPGDRHQVVPVASSTWACSLFAALGDPGGMLYGRNFDWEYSPALLLFTDPPGEYASVSMVDIAYLVPSDLARNLSERPLADRRPLLEAVWMPFDGMNERGLVVGMAAVPPSDMPHDPARTSVDSLRVIREMLDRAADVDEALAILGSYNITWGRGPALHYLIADATARAVLVEFTGGEMVVLSNEAPWHLATNHLRVTAPEGGQASGCWRYDAIERALTAVEGRLPPERAFDVLEVVSQDNTQWSVVYGISTGDVTVVMGGEYSTPHTFHMDRTRAD